MSIEIKALVQTIYFFLAVLLGSTVVAVAIKYGSAYIGMILAAVFFFAVVAMMVYLVYHINLQNLKWKQDFGNDKSV